MTKLFCHCQRGLKARAFVLGKSLCQEPTQEDTYNSSTWVGFRSYCQTLDKTEKTCKGQKLYLNWPMTKKKVI